MAIPLIPLGAVALSTAARYILTKGTVKAAKRYSGPLMKAAKKYIKDNKLILSGNKVIKPKKGTIGKPGTFSKPKKMNVAKNPKAKQANQKKKETTTNSNLKSQVEKDAEGKIRLGKGVMAATAGSAGVTALSGLKSKQDGGGSSLPFGPNKKPKKTPSSPEIEIKTKPTPKKQSPLLDSNKKRDARPKQPVSNPFSGASNYGAMTQAINSLDITSQQKRRLKDVLQNARTSTGAGYSSSQRFDMAKKEILNRVKNKKFNVSKVLF